MRFGVCAGVDKAERLADAGYDYIELAVGGDLVPDRDDAVWEPKRRAIEAMPLRPEAFNGFVRALGIVGPDVDGDALRRYVDTALARAQIVGGRIIVFGSGGARQVPDGFGRDVAERQILQFLGYCAEASDRTGVVVAIEPLNKTECNIINTVVEGADYARRVGRVGVQNLADTYHMEKDGEPLDAIVATRDVLVHAHTADTGRRAPATGTYDHAAFFRALKQAGYDARVSIECGWGDFAAEIGPALAHLRAAHAAA